MSESPRFGAQDEDGAAHLRPRLPLSTDMNCLLYQIFIYTENRYVSVNIDIDIDIGVYTYLDIDRDICAYAICYILCYIYIHNIQTYIHKMPKTVMTYRNHSVKRSPRNSVQSGSTSTKTRPCLQL